MRRPVGLVTVVVATLVLGVGCGGGRIMTFAPRKVGGLTLPGRVAGRSVEAATRHGFAPLFWTGVNLGSTVPGRQPGEVAATRRDYDRWLVGIGELGARVIRIYTILRPSFYDALAAYNEAHVDRPLFVVQGVWLPDEAQFDATGNAYTAPVTSTFESEIRDAVAVVHGDATLPQRPGHAGGTYRSNVSRWVLAYSIGIEWDPNAVRSTDRLNAHVKPYRGRYFRASADATPFESWLASMLDHTAADEAARGWSRPLTFTNWLTLDPLHHAYEPLATEDLVSVDATHIASTHAWPGGFFASYHAYPYYPDFMRLTASYQKHKGPGGKIDPYAGYLHALRAHHGEQAVMITEFGVPSSLGIAHYGPAGRDQGGHSEQQALGMDADMLRAIKAEGFAGGIVFEWIDEWFKFTWNTVDLQLPADRRQLWHDVLTNEEYFGVVAADPGTRKRVVDLDGKDTEWSTNGSQVVAESRGAVREVRAVKDEEYLYLLLRLDEAESWRTHPITVGLDTRPGGNRGLPGHPGVFPQADAALVVGPAHAELLQAAWWEPTRIRYGPLGYGYIRFDRAALEPGSGAWVHPLQIVDKPYVVPATGKRRPVEVHELSVLPIGSGDPRSPDFDSRTLVAAHGNVVEVRLPWALLGYADPSSLTLYVEHPKGPTTTLKGGRIGIGVLSDGGALLESRGYAWEPWQRVTWHERKKAGFADLARTMRQLSEG